MATPPTGMQINNPGNIKREWVKDKKTGKLKEVTASWKGMSKIQLNHDFVTFDTPEDGLRAMARNVVNDQKNHKHWTLRTLITSLSPKKENKTAVMIRRTAADVGRNPDDVINLRENTDLLKQVLGSLVPQESGYKDNKATPWFTPGEISTVVDDAVVDIVPGKPPAKSNTHKDGAKTFGKKNKETKKTKQIVSFTISPISVEHVSLVFDAPDLDDDEDDDSGGGQLAARLTDHHDCPLFTATVAHVGGPVTEGSTNVIIEGEQAARVGDCLACAGATDVIASGSETVYINGLQAARVTDVTDHGGVLASGAATVHFA